MKRLTLKRSLELCMKLWTWLRDNPEKAKHDWPGWSRFGDVDNDCFACEYDRIKTKFGETSCNHCPLRSLWGSKSCVHPSSPYSKWDWALDTKIRKSNAKKIADFCKKELDKLNKGGMQ